MITFLATLKSVRTDEDGESVVQFRSDASNLAPCVGLTALTHTCLRVTVTVEAETPPEPVKDTPSLAQYALSERLVTSLGWSEAVWRPKLKALCGVEHRNELTALQMNQWLNELERHETLRDAEHNMDVPF